MKLQGFGKWRSGLLLAATVVLASNGIALANEGEADKKPPVSSIKSGRPIPMPEPGSRTVPELLCTSNRLLTITNDTFVTAITESPRRMRLRGNMVYWGGAAGDETFWGTINRTDRRRWVANTAVMVLEESLKHGTWFDLQTNSTFVRHLSCSAVETPKP